MSDNKVRQVAAYFLEQNAANADNDLTQLKLQKLLYYGQGLCLAISGKPLFGDKIHAWQHGPVCTEIYHDFQNGACLLSLYENNDELTEALSSNDKSLIRFTNMVYGRYGALKLRNMTHEESPWKDTTQTHEIDQSKIKSYFEKVVEDDDNFALRHSDNNEEMEDVSDLLAVLKYAYDDNKKTISHEEFWRDIV